MRKVIFSIGIPGIGKTTVLKEFADCYGYAYVSPDEIRQQINGDASDQRNGNKVWEMAFDRMQSALSEGTTIVFDATQSNKAQRKQFIENARAFGAEKIQALFFDAPLQTAIFRNSQRERTVPLHVLERMNKSLLDYPPLLEEGIDALFKIDQEGRIIGLQKKLNSQGAERDSNTELGV